MIWARKSQQPETIAKPETEKMKSSLDCSPLLEETPHSSNAATNSQPTTKDHTDWSLLPRELLHIISQKLEDCFDVIHARSVCHLWRSVFPFPSSLLRTSYSLPSFSQFDQRFKGVQSPSCTLEKFPVFFFRVRAPAGVDGLPSEFFVGGINQDKSKDHMELRSRFQCSVKVKIPGSEPILLNVLDCQILPLGYQFRMVGWDRSSLATSFSGVACLPLDKEGGKKFVVLIAYSCDLFLLRSSEMKWMRLENISIATCKDIVTFRGKFYVNFHNRDIFVIDPYSVEATPLIPLELAPLMPLVAGPYLVPCGNDELFLVERILARSNEVLDLTNLACRVRRLDKDASEWVVVTDLGDRVLLIGQPGNSSCSAKEFPNGCGVSGDSFLFISEVFGRNFYKYGVDTGNAEDNLNIWRYSRETHVTIFNTKPMVAFRVESSKS